MSDSDNATVLLAGATGATGRLLAAQLLERGWGVKAIVRSRGRLPEAVRNHERLSVIEASLLDLSDGELRDAVSGCSAVASCLGHNLSFKGMFGAPRRLVTDAVRRLCEAVRTNGAQSPVRFVLMNTVGNRNRDLDERIPALDRLVIGVLRALMPPVPDNEEAAEYLRAVVGHDDGAIEWVAVRPDSLIDSEAVTPYDLHPTLSHGPIFGPGKTSRINVAHFMAELVTNDGAWREWKGQMPVITNSGG